MRQGTGEDGVAPREKGDPPRQTRGLFSPFQSLPSRIITWVFATAMVTSLAVTGISTRATESFLRGKIDERFPALLEHSRERIDLWYAQRQLDIETFARSATLTRLRQAVRGEAVDSEVHKYLRFVLEGFPQYRTLFVLDPEGRSLVSVGEPLPSAWPPLTDLAALERPRVGPVRELAGPRVQVISSPVRDAEGVRISTLHGVIGLDALDELLASESPGGSTRVVLVSREGETLGASNGESWRAPAALPEPGDARAVVDYRDAHGVRVVGSTLELPRFGWRLVVEQDYEEAFAPVVTILRRTLAINLGIVAFFGLAAFQIARSIVRPVHALADAARRIAEGETGVEIRDGGRRDEIGVLTGAFNEMSARLARNRLELQEQKREIERANARLRSQNDELQQANELLEQLSFTDGLTRLHNHRFFQDRLRLEMKRAARSGEPLSLILLDIDDFKRFNDRHGHAAGDTALRRVAHVVNNMVRDVDLPARYGGEEFAVLAPQTPLDGVRALAEKIRDAIETTRIRLDDGAEVQVTVSAGVARFRGDRKSFFDDADRALYRAKACGKNRVAEGEDESPPG